MSLLKEIYHYMMIRKKFWLAPIIFVCLILGSVLVLVQGSAVAPFIYTIF